MKVLIIRPAALGDTLMLVPGLDQIRESCSVTLVGRRPGIDHVSLFAGLCLDFEGMGWHTIFTDRPEVPKLPRLDIVAAFLRDVDGMVRRNLHLLFPDARVHVFPGLPAETEGIHAALHLARCLRRAGCTEVDPEECIEKALRAPLLRDGVAQGLMGGPGKGTRVIFHPGSGGREKNHSPQFWLDLIDILGNLVFSQGLHPTILLGPAEEGLRPLFEMRLRKVKHEVLISPAPEELVSLLSDGALFVGQDSGVTHLSAMLGVRTLALFRSSSIPMWRPLGPRVSVIQDKNDRIDISVVLKEAESCLKNE